MGAAPVGGGGAQRGDHRLDRSRARRGGTGDGEDVPYRLDHGLQAAHDDAVVLNAQGEAGNESHAEARGDESLGGPVVVGLDSTPGGESGLLEGGVSGGAAMYVVAAVDRAEGMRCVLGLFEGVVTGAADGYARMADRPASTLLHLGPGLANGLSNLHNAMRAQSPQIAEVTGARLYAPTHTARITRGAGRVPVHRIPYPVGQAAAIPSHLACATPSVISRTMEAVAERKRRGGRVLGLHVGEPDFDTPRHIKEAGIARRQIVARELTSIPGLSCVTPQGAFCAFPSWEPLIGGTTPGGQRLDTDEQFCQYLLHEFSIAVMPGAPFGAPGHFRISYACSPDVLREAMAQLRMACKTLTGP
jgi:Thiamine pyrophosphate enzyme, N-terminal TPP binding domain/Aminotransferase class I and II